MGACVEAPPPAPPGAPADGRILEAPQEPQGAADAPTAEPAGPHCETARFWSESGQSGATVVLSGIIEGEGAGAVSKLILLDLVAEDSEQVVWGFTCDRPGVFSVSVPAELGAVRLSVWLDATGDGPSDDDAQGALPGLVIATEDLGALAVSVRAP